MSLQNLVPFKTLLQLPMEDLQRRVNDPNEAIPGHLLLSAMKAKGAMQAGAQQPVPPTVKEQVSSGIGAMMPQQGQIRGFQQGGGVYGTELPEDAEARGIETRKRILRLIGAPFDAIVADWDKVKNKSRRMPYEGQQRYPATIPTEPTGPYRPEGHQYPAVNAGNSTAELPQTLPVSQRSRTAGVAAVGPNPTSKYKEFPKYDVTARDLNSISVPEISVNAALPESIQDIIAQRAEAQQQAQANARTAGLTAFGEAMLAPGRRGFGAAFPGAANKWVGTHQGIMSEADKEDARLRAEQRATNMAMGAEKVANEGKMYDRRLAERGFEVERADKAWKAGFDITDATNKHQIALEELNIRRAQVGAQMAAVKEAAAARKDAQLFNVIQRMDAQAATAAQKASEAVWDSYKNDARLLTGDPVFRALVGAEANQAATKALDRAQRTINPYLKAAGIPLPDMSPAAVGGTAKRAFPGS